MLIRARIIPVIHAGAEIRIAEILVLVIQTERMTDLLTHHHLSPCQSVVRRHGVVGIVHFYRAISDVVAVSPDRGDASQPFWPYF